MGAKTIILKYGHVHDTPSFNKHVSTVNRKSLSGNTEHNIHTVHL